MRRSSPTAKYTALRNSRVGITSDEQVLSSIVWLAATEHLHQQKPACHPSGGSRGIRWGKRLGLFLRIPYTRHANNEAVWSITGCLPVSDKVKSFRFRFFGHLARSSQRKTTTVSSPLHCDHQQTGEDPLDDQEPPG